MTHSTDTTASALGALFGDNRAEWPPERFGSLFIEPAYLTKLESHRPSLLVGGRGTGKTTTLKSLRFNVHLERLEAKGLTFSDQDYLGIYLRINKNRVRAFKGEELTKEEWGKAFAHYFNLLGCIEITKLAQWLADRTEASLSQLALDSVCRDLAISLSVRSLDELLIRLEQNVSLLQIYVNNPTLADRPLFSIAEAPLITFAQQLYEQNVTEQRILFCCIDEYENLLDEQQSVLNSYIKHAEPPLSYKVGVRKNGLRTRHTTDGDDLLQTPDDYREIEIAAEGFELFARAVAQLRLRRAREQGASVPESLDDFLQEFSFAEEARKLGCDRISEGVLGDLGENPKALDWVRSKPTHEIYFLRYWSESLGGSIGSLAEDWRRNETLWRNRFNNYGYASLFWLSRGRKGTRIRKYYCGSRVILSLAAGNIRYFLELLDASCVHELASRGKDLQSQLRLSPKSQTIAARNVGHRRLQQLEGLAAHGTILKGLVLAIGKVFFELARSPLGKTPEVTSFVLGGTPDARMVVEAWLKEGVSHLALEATPRTKATTSSEMRDDEYRLHPIFCAFFEISHRRKRRLTFDAEHLRTILEKPSKSIARLLDTAEQTPEDDLPSQLALFSGFYGSNPNRSP